LLLDLKKKKNIWRQKERWSEYARWIRLCY